MTAATASRIACPPLESGDRLSQPEFHRRYELHPEMRHAELIEGVVYVSSPLKHGGHGKPSRIVSSWLGVYEGRVGGNVDGGDSSTAFILNSEVQPDHFLRLCTGGTSTITEDDYLSGPPEFAFEIAASSASYDLGVKKELYRRAGVREYVVWQLWENRLDWFELRDAQYRLVLPDLAGIIASIQFPGLRLDVNRLLAEDMAGVLPALDP